MKHKILLLASFVCLFLLTAKAQHDPGASSHHEETQDRREREKEKAKEKEKSSSKESNTQKEKPEVGRGSGLAGESKKDVKSNNCSEFRTQSTYAGAFVGAGVGTALGKNLGGTFSGGLIGGYIGNAFGKKMQDDCEKVFAEKQKQIKEANKKAAATKSGTTSNQNSSSQEVYTSRESNWD